MPEQVGSGSTSDRDNLTYIEHGDVFYNTETGQLQVRKNDGWTSLTKTITDTNAFKITSGVSVPVVDSNSKEGNIFYNSSTGKIRIREESAWQVTSKRSIKNRDEFKILHGTSSPSANTLQRVFYNTNTKKLQYLKNDSWRSVAEEEVAGDTFNVGVDSYKFSLNNAVQPELNLYRGNEYVFNQSSADNSGQRLFVSNDLSGRSITHTITHGNMVAGGASGLRGTGGNQGQVYSSAVVGSGWEAVNAFNGTLNSLNDAWHSASFTIPSGEGDYLQSDVPELGFEFPNSTTKRIVKYSIWPNGNPQLFWSFRPRGWEFRGAASYSSYDEDDPSTYTILHTVYGPNPSASFNASKGFSTPFRDLRSSWPPNVSPSDPGHGYDAGLDNGTAYWDSPVLLGSNWATDSSRNYILDTTGDFGYYVIRFMQYFDWYSKTTTYVSIGELVLYEGTDETTTTLLENTTGFTSTGTLGTDLVSKWTIPTDASDTMYYASDGSANAGGKINITDVPAQEKTFVVDFSMVNTSITLLAGAGGLTGTGNPNNGVVTSSTHHGGYISENAFNGNTVFNEMWRSHSSVTYPWISFEFPYDVTITKYKLWRRVATHSVQSPRGWELRLVKSTQTYNESDSNTYTLISDISNQTAWPDPDSNSVSNDEDRLEFNIPLENQEKGRTIILYITQKTSGSNNVDIGEIAYYGKNHNNAPDIPAFTLGGLAQPTLNLYRDSVYKFDQSDPDNSGQRLYVSNDLNGRAGSSYNNSSSKTNPIILGHLIDSTMNLPRNIAIDSSRKVAFMVGNGNNNLLQIINIADPLNMTLISSLPGATTTMDKIYKLAYDSLRKLVFIGSNDTNNIGIVDVSNLNQPTLITTSITTHNRFNDFRHIVYDDTRQLIFITNYDGKVSCYEVSNYNSPVFKDEVQISIGGSFGMAIDTIRKRIFVCSFSRDALTVIDVTNPSGLIIKGTVTTESASPNLLNLAYDVAYDNVRQYVYTTGAHSPGALVVVDVSDPDNPNIVGNLDATLSDPDDYLLGVTLDLERNLAFVAEFGSLDSSLEGALLVIDIANDTPVQIGSVTNSTILKGPTGIAFDPTTNIVYAACKNSNSIVAIETGSTTSLTENTAGVTSTGTLGTDLVTMWRVPTDASDTMYYASDGSANIGGTISITDAPTKTTRVTTIASSAGSNSGGDTYTKYAVDVSLNRFTIGGLMQPTLNLYKDSIYRFDQSDPDNSGQRLYVSNDLSGRSIVNIDSIIYEIPSNLTTTNIFNVSNTNLVLGSDVTFDWSKDWEIKTSFTINQYNSNIYPRIFSFVSNFNDGTNITHSEFDLTFNADGKRIGFIIWDPQPFSGAPYPQIAWISGQNDGTLVNDDLLLNTRYNVLVKYIYSTGVIIAGYQPHSNFTSWDDVIIQGTKFVDSSQTGDGGYGSPVTFTGSITYQTENSRIGNRSTNDRKFNGTIHSLTMTNGTSTSTSLTENTTGFTSTGTLGTDLVSTWKIPTDASDTMYYASDGSANAGGKINVEVTPYEEKTYAVDVSLNRFTLGGIVQPTLNLYRDSVYKFDQSDPDNVGQRLFVSNDVSGRVDNIDWDLSSSFTITTPNFTHRLAISAQTLDWSNKFYIKIVYTPTNNMNTGGQGQFGRLFDFETQNAGSAPYFTIAPGRSGSNDRWYFEAEDVNDVDMIDVKDFYHINTTPGDYPIKDNKYNLIVEYNNGILKISNELNSSFTSWDNTLSNKLITQYTIPTNSRNSITYDNCYIGNRNNNWDRPFVGTIHSFEISETLPSLSENTNGVTSNGTLGTDLITRWRVPTDASNTMYYASDGSANAGGTINIFNNTNDATPPTIVCVTASSAVNVISSGGNKYRFNGDSTYVANKYYGLGSGTFTFTGVPSGHPIAILNAGKTSLISYTGDNANKSSKTVSGTTSDGTYDFYHGDVTVTVSGDFGSVSVYCYNHGYMGGENLLRYSSSCDISAPTIVTEGLKIYLDAANYSGSGTSWPNAAPASSPYPDAILSGNPTYHSENGGVLEFNNTNYASINASSLTSPYNQVLHSFSYNIWIKPSELTNWSCVIDQNVDDYFFGWVGPGVRVYNPSHSPSPTRTSGGGGLGRPYHYRPGRLELNTWYNLVLTHEVNRLRVYVNAQLVETIDPVDVNYTGTAHWRFMSSGNPPNETAKGKLGIAMVYDRALTHKEVLNNYNIHRERFGTQTATYTAGIPVYSSDAPTVITRYVEIEPAEDPNNNWLSSDYTTPLTNSEMDNNSIVTNQP